MMFFTWMKRLSECPDKFHLEHYKCLALASGKLRDYRPAASWKIIVQRLAARMPTFANSARTLASRVGFRQLAAADIPVAAVAAGCPRQSAAGRRKKASSGKERPCSDRPRHRSSAADLGRSDGGVVSDTWHLPQHCAAAPGLSTPTKSESGACGKVMQLNIDFKGSVARDGFGFWWHVWLVLGLNAASY